MSHAIGGRWTGLAMVLMLGWARPAGALTRYVSLSGSSTPPYTNIAAAATNIQAAIDVASAGDEILVQPGLYLIGAQIQLPVGKSLTLRSTTSRGAILDAQRLCAVMVVYSTNSVVEGFVVRNGVDPSYGGGVYLAGAGSVLRDCLVVSNQSWGAGGVMVQADGARVERCDIKHNLATYWGGGLIFYDDTKGVAEGCTIANNVASNMGGGVAFQYNGTVSNCWIADNFAVHEGGGVHLENGGTIVNSVLVGNRAGDNGGGVHAQTGGRVLHCTVVSNSAGLAYGGAFLSLSTSMNSIVYFNAAPLHPDLFTNNLSLASHCCSPAPLGGSNFTNAPAFVDVAGQNFRLVEGSSCIDTGQDLPTVTRDYDGTTRPRAGVPGGVARYDVGAYEYIPTIKQYFSLTQPVIGYANRDWSFMTAWNLSTGRLEVSPRWYNGNSTFTYTLDTARQWVAIFLYDEGTSQTRELRWAHRQPHVQ